MLNHSVLQKNHARDVNHHPTMATGHSDPFSFPGLVRLAETVPRIGDCKGAVRLGGHLDPVSGSVVDRRRGSVGAGLRWSHRCDRDRGRLLVDGIRDEDSWHRVFLAAQLGEVYLPEILETRRGVDDLHHHGFAAFANSVIHDRDPRANGVYQNLGV